jgi:hypothetical protein
MPLGLCNTAFRVVMCIALELMSLLFAVVVMVLVFVFVAVDSVVMLTVLLVFALSSAVRGEISQESVGNCWGNMKVGQGSALSCRNLDASLHDLRSGVVSGGRGVEVVFVVFVVSADAVLSAAMAGVAGDVGVVVIAVAVVIEDDAEGDVALLRACKRVDMSVHSMRSEWIFH